MIALTSGRIGIGGGKHQERAIKIKIHPVTYLLNIPVTGQKPDWIRILGKVNDFGLHSCRFFICFAILPTKKKTLILVSPLFFFGSIGSYPSPKLECLCCLGSEQSPNH